MAAVKKVIIHHDINGIDYDLYPRTSVEMVDYSINMTLKDIILYIEQEIENMKNENIEGDGNGS